MSRMPRLADVAWAMVPWCVGLLGLVAVARATGSLALAAGASGLAWALLATGIATRRRSLLDASLVAMLVAAFGVDLGDLGGLPLLALLASLAACGLGNAMAHHVIQQAEVPLGAVATSAAGRIVAAGGLAWFLVQGLAWGASQVSARWVHSLDRSSPTMLAILGALLLAGSAATTAIRVAWRRRSDPSQGPAPDSTLASEPPL